MRKLLFTAFATIAILGCSNDLDKLPCMTCGDEYNPYSSGSHPVSSSSVEYTGGSCNISDYRTVQIGKQVWMAENLNCDVEGGYCYDNEPANCAKYGRLYDWETAMNCEKSSCYSDVKYQGICPSGWHIPSIAEWGELENYVESSNGCRRCAAKYLKATSEWRVNGNGNDKYGFSALPGGYGDYEGYFYYVGNSGRWWTATWGSNTYAYYRDMNYRYEYMEYYSEDKSFLYSVRCLQD